MRILGEDGKNLGVFPIEEALAMAMEKGLDLIEVSPEANPPVTKIISFDKFRYQKGKELKKEQKENKAKELKHVRVTPKMAKHDLEVKQKQVLSFFEKGHRVEINLFLRGREKAHQDWGLKKLDDFLKTIEVPFVKAGEPKFIGKGFAVQIFAKK